MQLKRKPLTQFIHSFRARLQEREIPEELRLRSYSIAVRAQKAHRSACFEVLTFLCHKDLIAKHTVSSLSFCHATAFDTSKQ